jgi:hypothetical protein
MFCSGIRPIRNFSTDGFFAGAGGSCGEHAAKSGRHNMKRTHAIGHFGIATFYMKSRNDGKNGIHRTAWAATLRIQAPGELRSNCKAYSLR